MSCGVIIVGKEIQKENTRHAGIRDTSRKVAVTFETTLQYLYPLGIIIPYFYAYYLFYDVSVSVTETVLETCEFFSKTKFLNLHIMKVVRPLFSCVSVVCGSDVINHTPFIHTGGNDHFFFLSILPSL